MKTKIVTAIGIASLAIITSAAARPVFSLQIVAPAPVVTVPPPVVVQTPPPAVAVSVGVPDTYVWDGYEYVGLVGNQYYYLGPNHVWIAMDPVRLGRFHTWESAHADWRSHAIHNMNYRRDAAGHDHPLPGDYNHHNH